MPPPHTNWLQVKARARAIVAHIEFQLFLVRGTQFVARAQTKIHFWSGTRQQIYNAHGIFI